MGSFRSIKAISAGGLIFVLVNYAQANPAGSSNLSPETEMDGLSQPGLRTASGIDMDTVQCAWASTLVMKTYSELCHPDGDKELKDDIDYEIAATAEFLVANSSDPKATKDALDRALAGNQSALRAFPKSKTALLCQAGPDEHEHGLPSAMYRALGAKTHEERRAAVTRLLTEPGPPLGMCFP